MKALFKKWGHCLLVLYGFIYIPTFNYLERTISDDSEFNIIHCALDEKIPFCEYFVIPYVGWYLLIIGSLIYFAIYNPDNFKNMMKYLICPFIVMNQRPSWILL